MVMKIPVDSRGSVLHTNQLYPLLGLKPGNHLPADGLGPQIITDGYGREFKIAVSCKITGKRKFEHRVKVWCTCEQWVPFGRLTQHLFGSRKSPRKANHP